MNLKDNDEIIKNKKNNFDENQAAFSQIEENQRDSSNNNAKFDYYQTKKYLKI